MISRSRRALCAVIPLMIASVLALFVLGGTTAGNGGDEVILATATATEMNMIASFPERRRLPHSDNTCDDDTLQVVLEGLRTAASPTTRTQFKTLLSPVEPAADSPQRFLIQRNLRFALYRNMDLWSHSAMAAVVSMLRVWHAATGNSTTASDNVRLMNAVVVRRDCWSFAWREVSDHLTVVLDHRLRHMGHINNGVIYLCPGFGSLVATRKKGTSFRAGWFPQKLVAESAAKHVTNFTIFFLTFHDEDIYIKTRKKAHLRSALLHLLQEFPNFFLMHYSPSLVMPYGAGASLLGDKDPFYVNGTSVLTGAPRVVGALHPRMLPVPHSPTQISETVGLFRDATFMSSIRNVEKRTPLVVWRGATTGSPVQVRHYARGKGPLSAHRDAMRRFEATDRYRMVAAFNDPVAKTSRYPWADVAFSGFCQEVKAADVPRHAGKLGVRELSSYRVHIDVDGNTNSWEGLRWRLLFGMVVAKVESSHGFTQWYYRLLRNNTHLLHAPVDGIADAAKQLLDNTSLAVSMAAAAYNFGQEHLTLEAMESAVATTVRDAWRIGYDDQTKWCLSPC